MSSGTKYQPDAWKRMSETVSKKTMGRINRLGMSPRQQALQRLWSVYSACQYDNRRTDWDGTQHYNSIEKEAIASAGFIPPGFYDAGGQTKDFPSKFRRPATPYHLGKVIVDRFTGMLFSEKRHPKIRAYGDPDTEDWLEALAQTSRLWNQMILARRFGGATGTVAVGFSFVEGKPIIEPHDPRWCIPDFIDRNTKKLKSLEKRFMFPDEVRDPDTGEIEQVWIWYRRVIDEESDIIYEPAMVEEGDEPEWKIASQVDHNLGFCPVVWVQNLPIDDDIDGEPDCHGTFDMMEAMDALLSMAFSGTILNCEPTVIVSSTDELNELRKGSNHAVKLTNGDAKYMEHSGSGPSAAREMARELRSMILEVAQCVLDADEKDASAKTATEVNRKYSSMLAKADVLREQYGQRCILPLIEMMVEAARKLGAGKPMEGGGVLKEVVKLPPRIDEDGNVYDRVLGSGGVLDLQWPGYFEPSLDDAIKATQAASAAKLAGLIDMEHAVKFVANYFGVENVAAMMESAQDEAKEKQDSLQSELLAQVQNNTEDAPPSNSARKFPPKKF